MVSNIAKNKKKKLIQNRTNHSGVIIPQIRRYTRKTYNTSFFRSEVKTVFKINVYFVSECIVCSLIYAPDLFFFSCSTHLRIQFRLLQHALENLFHESKNPKGLVLDDREFRAKFKSMVIWHQELIE